MSDDYDRYEYSDLLDRYASDLDDARDEIARLRAEAARLRGLLAEVMGDGAGVDHRGVDLNDDLAARVRAALAEEWR